MTELEQITHYASLLFSYDEVAILLHKSDKFIFILSKKGTEEYNAYMLGMLNTEEKIRAEIINSAELGSPAAQKDFLELVSNVKSKNQRNG